MMMTFTEVKGHQRVKCGKLCGTATIYWSKEPLIQAKIDDFHGSQRPSEAKYGKVCAMATIFGQKSC